jgi:adenosylcobinamide-GDP ribazoletransferase
VCDSVGLVVVSREYRALLTAVSFLTRIPVQRVPSVEDVARSGAYFPLVGAGIGALTGSLARLSTPQMALFAQTALTGALHLDALADSADALGARDRARALEIMRDSRIGSFGTAALCLDLMIKAAALEKCEHPVRVTLRAGALSRAVPVIQLALLPYARPNGTAQALSTGSGTRAAAAAALAVVISRDPGATGIAALVMLASAGFSQHKLGGVTGDTLGATIELIETAILAWNAR